MAYSTKTLKILALAWDILYAIIGLIVIGVGIFILVKIKYFNVDAFIILGLGIVVVLTAIFGSLGALRENSKITKTFAIIVLIWALLQILIIGFFWVFQTTILIKINDTFDQLWKNEVVPVKPDKGSQIANIERWLECCGNVGPSDYMLPPYSCYSSTDDKLNLEGCRQKFLDYFYERWQTFNFFCIGLVLLELICAAFAWILASSIVNRWRRSKYYPK